MQTLKQFAMAKTRGMVTLRWILLILLIGCTALVFSLHAAAQTKYVIVDGDSVIVCMSDSTNPKTVVAEAGLELNSSDTITKRNNDGVLELHINRVHMISVKERGHIQVIGAYEGDTVADVLESLDIVLSDSDILSCGLDTETYDGMTIEITRVVLDTHEYDESIPFGTRVFEDSSLAPGTEQVLLEGKEGLTHYVAQITYENGIEVHRTILSQQMVSAPQDAIILKGVDRSVMEQTFTHVSDYIESDRWYSYVPAQNTTTKLVPGTTLPYNTAVRFEATAYTCNSPNYLGDGRTFTGTNARVGVVAVDPNVIPLGTKMYIASADGEYIYGYCVAEDTGSLIQGNIVDLYYNTHDECMEFGRRDVIIYFLESESK